MPLCHAMSAPTLSTLQNGILRRLLMRAGYVPSGDLNGLPGKSLTHLVDFVQVLYTERIAQPLLNGFVSYRAACPMPLLQHRAGMSSPKGPLGDENLDWGSGDILGCPERFWAACCTLCAHPLPEIIKLSPNTTSQDGGEPLDSMGSLSLSGMQ